LTLKRANTYNIAHAEVAQVVEQRTENPRVSSSTLLLGTSYAIAERARSGGMASLLIAKPVSGSGLQ
jgi:hypothetical protein